MWQFYVLLFSVFFFFFFQLKALRLKELADDLKNQRMKKNSDTKGQKKSNQKDFVGSDLGGSHVKELDEM